MVVGGEASVTQPRELVSSPITWYQFCPVQPYDFGARVFGPEPDIVLFRGLAITVSKAKNSEEDVEG